MSKTNKQYHHGDLAQTLIDSTAKLLCEKGPVQLSLREVARSAGVSHGAPAHHFRDKTGLLTEVATAGHRLLTEHLQVSQTDHREPLVRLKAAGEAYVRFALSYPGHFSVMFQHDLIDSTNSDYRQAAARAKQVLESCIQDLAKDQAPGREISQRQIQATLAALWSQVHGFSQLWQAGNFGDPDDPELLTQLLSDMLSGISPHL